MGGRRKEPTSELKFEYGIDEMIRMLDFTDTASDEERQSSDPTTSPNQEESEKEEVSVQETIPETAGSSGREDEEGTHETLSTSQSNEDMNTESLTSQDEAAGHPEHIEQMPEATSTTAPSQEEHVQPSQRDASEISPATPVSREAKQNTEPSDSVKALGELNIDEEFKGMVPGLQNGERKLLEESLIAEGCNTPLVVWNGVLIDGHTRYELCHKHGILFAVEEKQFNSRDEAKFWIIKNQLGRRNLTIFQKCELVLQFEDIVKAEAKKRMSATARQEDQGKQNSAGQVGQTRDILAEMAGVSHDTFDRVKYILGNGVSEKEMRELREGTRTINKVFTALKEKATPESVASAPKEPSSSEKALSVPSDTPKATVSTPNVSNASGIRGNHEHSQPRTWCREGRSYSPESATASRACKHRGV